MRTGSNPGQTQTFHGHRLVVRRGSHLFCPAGGAGKFDGTIGEDGKFVVLAVEFAGGAG